MAIKVGGTTVIDDSRNFTNIAGGFKTVNGTSVVGSGDISVGASTTFKAVGTYVFAVRTSSGSQNAGGGTFAGTALSPGNANGNTSATLGSGTWRLMGAIGYTSTGDTNTSTAYSRSLYVRIS